MDRRGGEDAKQDAEERIGGVTFTERTLDMLVLMRRQGEEICIGDNVRITVVSILGNKVRLGIEAPENVPVHRREVKEAIDRNKEESE